MKLVTADMVKYDVIFFSYCAEVVRISTNIERRAVPSAKSAFLLYIGLYSDMDVFSDNEHHQH